MEDSLRTMIDENQFRFCIADIFFSIRSNQSTLGFVSQALPLRSSDWIVLLRRCLVNANPTDGSLWITVENINNLRQIFVKTDPVAQKLDSYHALLQELRSPTTLK